MSKELEALKKFLDDYLTLCEKLHTNRQEKMLLDKNSSYNVLKTYLESIDNANPSEALECLEKLKGMEISSMPFSDEYGTQEVDLNDIRKVGSQLNIDFREYTATIKQALLKAQEPKQYLKWEDLEFKEKTSRIEVKLNETLYILSYVKRQYLDFVYLINNDSQIRLNSANDIQFFNDLHLERVKK